MYDWFNKEKDKLKRDARIELFLWGVVLGLWIATIFDLIF